MRLLGGAFEIRDLGVDEFHRIDAERRMVVGAEPLDELLRGEAEATGGARLDSGSLVHLVAEGGDLPGRYKLALLTERKIKERVLEPRIPQVNLRSMALPKIQVTYMLSRAFAAMQLHLVRLKRTSVIPLIIRGCQKT